MEHIYLGELDFNEERWTLVAGIVGDLVCSVCLATFWGGVEKEVKLCMKNVA